MAMWQRQMFLKPISVLKQDVASGVGTDITTWTRFYAIPWNKLGYLKRIEVGRGCDGASGCMTIEIWDNFYDPITLVSGLEKRQDITMPDGTAQMCWDLTEDIPLLGDIYAVPSISGADIKLCSRLMG